MTTATALFCIIREIWYLRSASRTYTLLWPLLPVNLPSGIPMSVVFLVPYICAISETDHTFSRSESDPPAAATLPALTPLPRLPYHHPLPFSIPPPVPAIQSQLVLPFRIPAAPILAPKPKCPSRCAHPRTKPFLHNAQNVPLLPLPPPFPLRKPL